MKVLITVLNRGRKGDKLILFGARHNYISINLGNNITVDIVEAIIDYDYKTQTGLIYSNPKPSNKNKYMPFLMDCIKYDFRVISINRNKLIRLVPDSNPKEYKQGVINPYCEEYEYEMTAGVNTIEIELIMNS